MAAIWVICCEKVRTPSNFPSFGAKSYLSAGIASASDTTSSSTDLICPSKILPIEGPAGSAANTVAASIVTAANTNRIFLMKLPPTPGVYTALLETLVFLSNLLGDQPVGDFGGSARLLPRDRFLDRGFGLTLHPGDRRIRNNGKHRKEQRRTTYYYLHGEVVLTTFIITPYAGH